MSGLVYGSAGVMLARGEIGWDAPEQGYVAALCSGAYRPEAGHATGADIAASELRGGTYVRRELGGRAVRLVAGEVELVADATSWPSLRAVSETALGWAVVLKQGASVERSQLVCAVEVPTFKVGTGPGLDFVVRWGAADKAGRVLAITLTRRAGS